MMILTSMRFANNTHIVLIINLKKKHTPTRTGNSHVQTF